MGFDVSEDNFGTIDDVDAIRMLLILVFALKIVIELSDLFLGAIPEVGLFFFLDLFVEEQLVV